MKNNKHGGFSCFIAIIMTSIIVLMTVLMRASSIRSDEAILTGSLIQQQDLILSQYCEKLLDWYGIYATTIPDECADAFLKASDSIKPLSAYSCKGMAPLDSGEDFREAVLDFARPRVPIQLTMQLVGRFTQINEIIQSQTIDFKGVDNESESTPSDDGSDPSKDTALDFSSIMDFLELIDKDSFEKNLTEETKESFTWDNLEELLKSDPENPAFEMDVSKEMKSQLSVTESNLNDLSFLLNQFYQIDSNEVYDKLCFEFYITSMFSCKTNMMIQNDIEINRKDLRNRSISTLPTHDPLEIEQIIFGYEDQGKNDFYTKSSH